MSIDLGGGVYGQRIGGWQAASIGPGDGDWVHGSVTCTNANTAYTATVTTPIASHYLYVCAQVSSSDTTPVEAVVRINADPTVSTSTNIDGVGCPVSGPTVLPLDGTTVATVRVLSPTAGAFVRFALANPTVT